jgi:predicted Zn-dependent peptidase
MKTIWLAALLASISLNVVTVSAQMKPIKFTEYDLPNGMHVILHHDKSAPVVSTLLHYKVGARDEDPARTGFAHFFEHLMFEGTKDIPRTEITSNIQNAGGNLNAYTATDQTVYFFNVPANELQLALWIEYQRMRGLLIDTTGVETQRGVVKEERNARYDNAPYGDLLERAQKNLFAGTQYEWTPIGSSQHIDSASIPEFQEFYDRFYQPNNVTLVVAGDFDEAEAKKYIKTYFGSIPKSDEIVRPEFVLKPLDTEIRRKVVDKKARLPLVAVGYRGPKVGDKDAYALSMLMNVVSNGTSSRLNQTLVEKDQVAVNASAFVRPMEYSGMIMAFGVAAPGKDIDSVENALYKVFEDVAMNGISDAEFSKAKNIEEASFVEGKKNVFDKAQTLAQYHTFYGKADLINTEIETYLAITKADIQRVAKEYLTTKNRVVLTYVPANSGNAPANRK